MKIGMIFSGSDGVFVGMGKELYDESRLMQEIFEEASNCLDTNFVKLCFASSDAEIKKMENAYVTLFTMSAGIAALLKELDIKPDKVAGYDLGEYAAIASINGISNPDALYLLNKYALQYQAVLDEKDFMVLRIIGIREPEIKAFCMQATGGDERADIAVYESEDTFVISGTKDSVTEIGESAKAKSGVKVTVLDPAVGLHSPLMDDILKNIKMYLEKVDFKDTEVPFVSGVIGEPLQEGEKIRAALMQHIHAPTQWAKVMQVFKDCDIIIEIGPGKYLQDLLKRVYPDKKIYRILTPDDVKQVKNDLP